MQLVNRGGGEPPRGEISLRDRWYPRQQLARILSDYQTQIGNRGEAVEESLQRILDKESAFVVTGQQVGFMGGPLYTFLKAISCLRLAKQENAIPLFWAATEDHDVDEVSWAYSLKKRGDLNRYRLSMPRGKFVEDLPWADEYKEEYLRFLRDHGIPHEEFKGVMDSTRYAEAMIRLLAKSFEAKGLLFVEPYLLRSLSKEFFIKEMKQAESFRGCLINESASLIASSRPAPIAFDTKGTNLFYKTDEGLRVKILTQNKEFMLGGQKKTLDQICEQIRKDPSRFSTNVAARPALQCHLIPTLAYVGGQTEIAYWKQLKSYFVAHEIPMPHVCKRMSAVMIPHSAGLWLKKMELDPDQPLPGSIKGDGVPSYALHYLTNLLRPKGKPQERLLNWWMFQKEGVDLVEELLHSQWEVGDHLQLWL